jgi:hypothetical protein
MDHIAVSMLSEKKANYPIELSWLEGQERRVFHFRDNTSTGLKMRIAINALLRNPGSGSLVKFTLRPHVPGGNFRVNTESQPVSRADFLLYHSKLLEKKVDIEREVAKVNPALLQEDMRNVLLSTEQKRVASEQYNAHLANQRNLRLVGLKLSMCTQAIAYKGLLRPVTFAGAAENARPEAGVLTGLLGMPYFVPPKTGVHLSILSTCRELPKEVANYLVSQVEEWLTQGRDLSELTVKAPCEALSEDGRLLALPTVPVAGDRFSVEEALILFSGKKLPKDFHLPLSWRAWQWLIASHNMVFKDCKVPLKNGLRREWNDPLDTKRKDQGVKRSEEIKELKKIIELQKAHINELVQVIETNLNSGSRSPSTQRSTKLAVENAGGALHLADRIQEKLELEETAVQQDLKASSASSDTQVDDTWYPLKMSFEGKEMNHFMPYDDDWWANRVDSVFEVSVFEEAGRLIAFAGRPQPVTASADDGEITLVARHSPGKTEPPKPKSAKKKTSSPSRKKGNVKMAVGDVPGNPAKIVGVPKGQPRSKTLTDGQRASLRRFFKLKDPLPATEWEALSSKEKRTYLSQMSIPRWAVAAVEARPDNLNKIISGKITADNYQKSIASAPVPKATGKNPGTKGRRISSSPRRGRSRSTDGRRRGNPNAGGHELIGKLVARLLALDS